MHSSLNVSQAQEVNEHHHLHQIQIQQVSPLSEDYHRCKTGFLSTKVEDPQKCFSPTCQKERRLLVHNCIGRVSLATRLFTTSLDFASLQLVEPEKQSSLGGQTKLANGNRLKGLGLEGLVGGERECALQCLCAQKY